MPMKIFDLAKELDMGAIDLVEALKAKGFPVRNHMSALTDEEVAQVMAEYRKSEPTPKTAKKKTAKKKAGAKKKVVKKKVVKKSGDAEETLAADAPEAQKFEEPTAVEAKTSEAKAEDDSSNEDKKKTVTKKKKTIVLRKGGEPEDDEPTAGGSSAKGGLRVVSMPKKVEAPVAKAASKAEVSEETTTEKPKKNELYKEKVHRFTPVFIPEKDEAAADDDGEVKIKSKGKEDEDDDDKGKRRLGGLASMMSGKKPVTSKSELLNTTRADSELKSYAALSGSGMPIYVQPKRKKVYSGPTKKTEVTEVKDAKRVITLHDGGYIVDVAKKLSVKFKELADKCLDLNLLIKPDDYIGIDLASQIANLYGFRVENRAFDEDAVLGINEDVDTSKWPLRNPIITIMGHVDHGKTTLLDYIRNEKVAAGEAGGITQHIGAYSVEVKGKQLTFLDTPGHAAFAAMRQRGADVTDIVVLVVAADDGVMPQTVESIKFCQNAKKNVIVAVNKMDKEGANPDRIKTALSEYGITPEDWGGETQFAHISALKGDGVDELLEGIALQAEIMELRADPKGSAQGVVIESKIEPGRGPVATILIQTGTLNKGDTIVAGETFGRARSLVNSRGDQLKEAGPSTPVQILGLADAPSPGDLMNVAKNEREAKKVAENRAEERRKLTTGPAKKKVSLEDFFAAAAGDNDEAKQLNLIIRSDVQGSYEAIRQSVEPLSSKEVEVRVISGGVGPITDSDIQLADSSGAFVFGFNMRPLTTARKLSEQLGIDVKTYTIIYELINDVKLAIEGMLEPEFNEEYIGRAEVKETFTVPKAGTIAGCVVVDGKIAVGCNVRLLRNGQIMHDGKMSSLKRFKDDAKEVKVGLECGIGLENFNDVKNGDTFECYIMQERKRTYDDLAKAEAQSGNNQPTL
ncbi:MAG: translation initiation factor IF-2 [Bdellovibrionales bacterium CG12_big_fil_rev_8_21_14_0_65_38_15]|nr:MAG: translation initiation factor IF-2 [Bdellovibrionales bacterium CG22_combo_CG10-13_8_21_14_all_38_13]PIQ56937.1 MAG: translation initiation factor IF-2 [Bdellovibrionales bacterium CG12_big_fil_rev_8_21_14_0_65_38_15]PIR29102.1 MAG: translation initiation factor IF-2 [Bdellovibrionales bacterium CG11_big_fil_rev_8_21_14_0_20_38_13]